MFIVAAAHFGFAGAERARCPRSKMARRTAAPKMTLCEPRCGPNVFHGVSIRVCSDRGFGALCALTYAGEHRVYRP